MNHKRSELNKALDQCPEIVKQAVWGDGGYRAQIELLKELGNLREVNRLSDQSIELTFSSCRACSAFCKAIEKLEDKDHE